MLRLELLDLFPELSVSLTVLAEAHQVQGMGLFGVLAATFCKWNMSVEQSARAKGSLMQA